MSAKKLLLGQYYLHNILFNNVIDDITDDESNQRIVNSMNNVKWLAGHLLWAQANLANIAGVKIEVPWRDQFHTKEGATEADRNAQKSDLPTLEQIRVKWNEFDTIIKPALENLPEEALNNVIEMKHPIYPFDNTLAGLWAFLNHHQAYTIGQIGILRRGLGKQAMKYS